MKKKKSLKFSSDSRINWGDFDWTNFPLNFLKAVVYSNSTPQNSKPETVYNDKDFLAPYLENICVYPDAYFVKKYRREIEEYFLPEGKHLKSVVKQLENMNYGEFQNVDDEDFETALLNLKQKKLSETLINVYLNELAAVGLQIDEIIETKFPKPLTIDLQESGSTNDVNLYPYQEDAVIALKKYFLEEDNQSGILQMPTGSGKTLTSVYFLMKEMASRGYQIIWIAHRFMLVEQAASVFYKLSPIIKENSNKKTFKMVCISSVHSSSNAIEKDDDLIVSMVQSISRNTNRLQKNLHDKVIIVVDEAHHALAPTYRRTITEIRKKNPAAKLLGLTATPIRANEKDTDALGKIFNNKIIYQVSMSKLISDGTLAKPVPNQIQTNLDIETIINDKEIGEIQKWKEIPETLVDKIARTNERNDIIVDEYVKNKDKYGKTLIFALNAIHCMALNDAFHAKGIKSDFVYTTNKSSYNNEVIERFRNNQLDVLININILTEGSDIPDIQTIFLTRPTSSDVLLMQMVGRGMRGVGAGGTETVNIVDFCDKWSDITRWINPEIIFGDDAEIIDPVYGPTKRYDLIPWDLIRAIMKGISYKGVGVLKRDSVLPIGWYDIIDEGGNDEQILVFENQMCGYENLKADLEKDFQTVEISMNNSDIGEKYFDEFGLVPTEHELRDLVLDFKLDNKFPELQTFEARDKIDPYKLAQEFGSQDFGMKTVRNKIAEIYKENRQLIDNLYGGQNYYERRIIDFMMYPDGVAPLGTIVEEVEKNFYKLDEEPFAESLDKLLDEVIKENSDTLGKNFVRPAISWTEKNYKTYFGIYYPEKKSIKINRVLDSKTIPREVLKYLIYHECLHQLISKHGREFRRLEQLFPNFDDQENFLDVKFPDFYKEYAM